MNTPEHLENDRGGDDSPETIEDALVLLKQGKEFEKKQKFWDASDKFIQGRKILDSLAKKQSRATEEDRQILSLYEEKSQEYLRQSRKSLLEAMTLEMEPDEKSTDFYENLTEEEAQLRLRIFCTLFSRKVDLQDSSEKNVDDLQWSIEERLQELNASLPSGFKTDDERMDSLNRGLNRLGLSLYPQKKPFERFEEQLPKSDEEQIEAIMAQAKDEVAFEKQFGGGPGVTAKSLDADDLDDADDDEEEDTDEDLKLDDDQLAIKHIRQRVVKAQTKLAEIVALLDEAKTARDEEERDVERYDDDSIEKPSSDSYLTSGKKKLRGAQRDLKKAMDEWNEEALL